MEEFNIIEYLSGLTSFVFDKAVLKRIAYERNVINVTMYEQLDQRIRDLLLADLLFTAVVSPSTSASHTNQHGAFTKTYGSQTIKDREGLYDIMTNIYKKYGDEKLKSVPESLGGLEWQE